VELVRVELKGTTTELVTFKASLDQAEALLVMGAGEKALTAAYASIKQAAAAPECPLLAK
jgi:hypothetical protein